MHRERLSQMVTMLRGLPEEKRSRFNLGEWSCGTSACAVGFACLDPVFNQQGLHLSYVGSPKYGNDTSWWAVMEFFEIFESQAKELFHADWYEDDEEKITPAQVADRIESFLAEHAEAV